MVCGHPKLLVVKQRHGLARSLKEKTPLPKEKRNAVR